MTINKKKELEDKLQEIEKKLEILVKDMGAIKKRFLATKNKIQLRQDEKNISKLKNKIISI